jgi:hypothetical protein
MKKGEIVGHNVINVLSLMSKLLDDAQRLNLKKVSE